MITFENVTKRYGYSTVLDEVTFDVSGGEFVVLTGRSGAGKTTLINTLIGFEKPNYGRVLVDGYDVTKLKRDALQEFRRKVGVVFQDYKLLPRKTVFENVAFAMESTGKSDAEMKAKVPELLENVGLSAEDAKKFPAQLSGGEKQRVAIARALINNPRLIIADEPTGNLDSKNSIEIANLLHRLNIQGATVILATHDQSLVSHLNQRVVTLEDGAVVDQ